MPEFPDPLPLASNIGRSLTLLCCCVCSATTAASPGQAVTEALADQAYRQQAYLQALQSFQTLDSYRAAMGAGASAYRLADWSKAEQAFAIAIGRAENDHQRASAWYNRANTLAWLGKQVAAADAYRRALQWQPTHARARRNLALLDKEISRPLPTSRRRMEQSPPATQEARTTDNGGDDDTQLAAALSLWQKTFAPDRPLQSTGIDDRRLALARYRLGLLTEDVSRLVRRRLEEQEAGHPPLPLPIPPW